MAGLGAGALLSGCLPAAGDAPLDPPLPEPGLGATPRSTRTPRIVTPTAPATPPGLIGTLDAAGKYAGRKLCFVLWDHQLARYAFRPRDLQHPVPMTCPLRSGAALKVTPAWQEYWRWLLRLCNPDMTIDEFDTRWDSLIATDRAFTNGTSPAEGNFRIHPITCGGATHEMVTGEPEGDYVSIYTLRWEDGPPPLPDKPEQIDMTRHFFATTASNVKLPDGSYRVNGFPQFENCIVPLISPERTDKILLSRVKPVDRMQRPYNP